MTTFSVIVPVSNGREFIAETLDAIWAQTHLPEEVIVVDDGSTDGTAEFVRERYPRVRVLSQPNRGPASARNSGAAAATGEYLVFCDADDVWVTWKLESQLHLIRRLTEAEGDPPGLLGSAYIDAGPRERVRRLMARARQRPVARRAARRVNFLELLAKNTIGAASAMVPRHLFQSLGGFDPAAQGAEDMDLWVRIAACRPVFRTSEPLYVRRARPGSFSGDLERSFRALVVIDRKWWPGKHPDLRRLSVYRRICSKQVLRFAHWCWETGKARPAGLHRATP